MVSQLWIVVIKLINTCSENWINKIQDGGKAESERAAEPTPGHLRGGTSYLLCLLLIHIEQLQHQQWSCLDI